MDGMSMFSLHFRGMDELGQAVGRSTCLETLPRSRFSEWVEWVERECCQAVAVSFSALSPDRQKKPLSFPRCVGNRLLHLQPEQTFVSVVPFLIWTMRSKGLVARKPVSTVASGTSRLNVSQTWPVHCVAWP